MMKNEPAFPRPMVYVPCEGVENGQDGMTLRDYFAAKAMQGCLAYSHCDPSTGNWQENSSPESVAKYAYEIADAMLKEREKTNG